MAGTIEKDDSGSVQAAVADMTTWGDWTILNKSGNWYYNIAPILYKPGVSYATLTGAPTSTVKFLKKNNQLFAIGHGTNRREVSASDADDIEDWTVTATNLAVNLPFEDMNTPIITGEHLGANIAVYGEDQLGLVYWIGPPDYWGRRIALNGIGAIGKQAVCADGPLNYGVSRNGCWRTDGNSYQYIDQGILHDYLQENVNWTQRSKILVRRNSVTRCIEFHFPMGINTENSEAWSYDPTTGGWGPVTAYEGFDDRKLFANCLGGIGDSCYLLAGDATATAALDLSTKPLLMQSESGASLHVGSVVDEIELFVKSPSNVQFRYGVSEDIDGTYNWSSWIDIVADLTTYQPVQASGAPLLSGIFHKLEFRSTAANWAIDLQGFVFYGLSEGLKRSTS